jgi:hypothetical protein
MTGQCNLCGTWRLETGSWGLSNLPTCPGCGAHSPPTAGVRESTPLRVFGNMLPPDAPDALRITVGELEQLSDGEDRVWASLLGGLR